MKNKLISISLSLMLIFISVISVDAIGRTPRIDLSEYEITLDQISDININGTCSICVGQLVGVYDPTGKIPYSYTVLNNTNSSGSFKVQVPARFLKTGTNIFKVKSLPIKNVINASNPKTLTIKIGANKQTQTITANDITIKINGKKNLNAKVSSGLPLTYISENSNIATVDANGNVIGRKVGDTKVIISQAGNAQYKPANKAVTVTVQSNTSTNSTISGIDAYQFPDTNSSYNLNCKSKRTISYKSSNKAIVSVNSSGKITAHKSGSAVITASDGISKKNIKVTVPKIRNRVEALKPWHDIMVDTYKYIYNRAYSGDNGKFWTTNGKWNGKTTKYGNRQSCITLPTTSLKRIGFLPKKGKSFWYDAKTSKNGGGKHEGNSAVRKLKKSSPYVTVTYPHKSYLSLIKSGQVVYGDIVLNGNKVNSGHTWIYMGQNPNDLRVFESGVERGIGGGAYVKWGFKNGNLHKPAKKTAKIKKQIANTKKVLKEHPASYFQGGNYQNNSKSKIHIVCHIKDFTIKTTCINGTITNSNRYMAKQDVTISYKPLSGKKLSYVEVDGVKVSHHNSSYVFKQLKRSHTVKVVYK